MEGTLEMKNFQTKTIKARLTAFLIMVVLALGLAGTQMNQVEATGSIGDLNVSIGEGGQLVIGGNSGMTSNKTSATAWTDFIAKYRNFIIGISGLGAVAMVMFFIFNFMKLGATSGNPSERTKALTGLIWSGVAAAGLGSVTIIVGFFYSAFK